MVTLPAWLKECPYCGCAVVPAQIHYWSVHPHSGRWYCGRLKCRHRGDRETRGYTATPDGRGFRHTATP